MKWDFITTQFEMFLLKTFQKISENRWFYVNTKFYEQTMIAYSTQIALSRLKSYCIGQHIHRYIYLRFIHWFRRTNWRDFSWQLYLLPQCLKYFFYIYFTKLQRISVYVVFQFVLGCFLFSLFYERLKNPENIITYFTGINNRVAFYIPELENKNKY